MNLQYSYSTAKRTRDFFEMIMRYINVLLLLLLLIGFQVTIKNGGDVFWDTVYKQVMKLFPNEVKDNFK